MKKYKFPLFILILLVIACNSLSNDRNDAKLSEESELSTFFQYNIWGAFVNRVFDGDLSVRQLQSKGDIGLGSFDLLDGEMVMLDGITYRIREDGVVSVGDKEDQIVYADATFFRKENEFTTNEELNYENLRKVLNSRIPSPNNFYAFKITGEFDNIKLGGLHKQTQPFTKGLDYLIPNRPVFEGKKIKGTMVGFYCPPFIGDINTAGYHFHFISDDKKLGGHIMEIGATSFLNVAMQKLVNYEFRLPQSQDFEKVQLDKQFQYNKK
jgi:acetolactate decarboxylase